MATGLPPLDTATLAQWIDALEAMTAQEAMAAIDVLSQRHGVQFIPQLSITSLSQTTAAEGTAVGNPFLTGFRDSGGLARGARTPDIFKVQQAIALTAPVTAADNIWTPAVGKKFRLLGGWMSSSVVTTIDLCDNAGAAITGPFARISMSVANKNEPFAFPGNGYLSLAANNILVAVPGAGATMHGVVFGNEE